MLSDAALLAGMVEQDNIGERHSPVMPSYRQWLVDIHGETAVFSAGRDDSKWGGGPTVLYLAVDRINAGIVDELENVR